MEMEQITSTIIDRETTIMIDAATQNSINLIEKNIEYLKSIVKRLKK